MEDDNLFKDECEYITSKKQPEVPIWRNYAGTCRRMSSSFVNISTNVCIFDEFATVDY